MPDPGINFKISYIAPKYARNHAGKHKNPPDSTLRKFSGSAHGTNGNAILVNYGNDLILYNNIKEIYSAGGDFMFTIIQAISACYDHCGVMKKFMQN